MGPGCEAKLKLVGSRLIVGGADGSPDNVVPACEEVPVDSEMLVKVPCVVAAGVLWTPRGGIPGRLTGSVALGVRPIV